MRRTYIGCVQEVSRATVLWLCIACCSTNVLLIFEVTELLNIAIKTPPNEQPAADEKLSDFGEASSVIMNPVLTKISHQCGHHDVVDDKNLDVHMITKKHEK